MIDGSETINEQKQVEKLTDSAGSPNDAPENGTDRRPNLEKRKCRISLKRVDIRHALFLFSVLL